MQWFLQVVRENDRHNGQSGAVERPDWGVGDMEYGRVFLRRYRDAILGDGHS